MSEAEAPPIAALFQVVFDQRVGYTIAWQHSLPDIDLDGVEYQCLPSGLHSVPEDLVYFVHGSYAGVSAFTQEEADKQHRNASFVAVGALVSRDFGRLGRGWVHAEALRELARKVVSGKEDAGLLAKFWDEHKVQSSTPLQSNGSAGSKRKRTRSDATDYWSSERMVEPDHPALSMSRLFKTFGPLLFPLYRAALLRQRLLLIGSAPVRPACNYVYDLSVLSSTSDQSPEPAHTSSSNSRLEPLFNLGVFDITRLETQKTGWIACTTDDILGEKKQLYEVLVQLPSAQTSDRRTWPKLRKADGTSIKATQRDFRRYTSLRRELKRSKGRQDVGMRYRDDEDVDHDDDDEEAPLVASSQPVPGSFVSDVQSEEAEVVEAESWTASAYRSLMWWSSAGEVDTWEHEEASQDQALLKDLPNTTRTPAGDGDNERREDLSTAANLVAYFHRLTASTLQTLAGIAEEADDQTEEGIEEDAIIISAEDMRRMGLDTWSSGDRSFVTDAMRLYFNREASVGDQGLSMCGVRIC